VFWVYVVFCFFVFVVSASVIDFSGKTLLQNRLLFVDLSGTLNPTHSLIDVSVTVLCSESSVLKVESFRWVRHFDRIEDYINVNTGCHSALLFPTLFGLRLAEDFEFGSRFNFLPICYAHGL